MPTRTHVPYLVPIALVGISVGICCRSGGATEPTTQAPEAIGNATTEMDAQGVEWRREYDQARIDGIEKALPVLLFVTTDNCLYCRLMQDQALQDASVVAGLKRDFVPAKLKLDPKSELAQQLQITIYPTTLIIATDGTILDYARGMLTPDDLQNRMVKAVHGGERLAALPAAQQ